MWEMSNYILIKLHHLKYIWTMYDVQLVNHKQIQHAYFLLFPLVYITFLQSAQAHR